MNEVGNVNCCTTGREVTGRPQIEDLTIFKYSVGIVPSFPHEALGLSVEFSRGEPFMSDSATRILVNLFDKLSDRLFAVTGNMSGYAL